MLLLFKYSFLFFFNYFSLTTKQPLNSNTVNTLPLSPPNSLQIATQWTHYHPHVSQHHHQTIKPKAKPCFKKKKNHQTKPDFHIYQQTPPHPPSQKKTINKAIGANHNATPICQNPPPMCHDIHHKPTQSSPTNKTNTHSILHADQCTPHQATTRPPRSTTETQLQTHSQNQLVNPSPPTTKSMELRWCIPIGWWSWWSSVDYREGEKERKVSERQRDERRCDERERGIK